MEENLTGTVWQEKKKNREIIDVLEDDGSNWIKIKRRNLKSRTIYKTRGRFEIECERIENMNNKEALS